MQVQRHTTEREGRRELKNVYLEKRLWLDATIITAAPRQERDNGRFLKFDLLLRWWRTMRAYSMV